MDEYSNIRIDIRQRADGLTVLVEGEIDLWTAHRFQAALATARASDAPAIVVDLDRVTFMDSSGLHVLVQCVVAAGMRRRITVTRGSPQVQRLFEISGISRYLSFTSSQLGSPATAITRGPGSTPEAPRSGFRSGASHG